MKAKDIEILNEFYDPALDKSNMHDYDDTRRPRLSLEKIHKMRKSRDIQKVDKQQRLKTLPLIYGSNEEEF